MGHRSLILLPLLGGLATVAVVVATLGGPAPLAPRAGETAIEETRAERAAPKAVGDARPGAGARTPEPAAGGASAPTRAPAAVPRTPHEGPDPSAAPSQDAETGAIEGLATDELGRPLEQFRVVLEPEPEALAVRHLEAGRFRVAELPAGTWRVTVEAPGHVRAGPLEARVPGDGRVLRAVLPRKGRVAGVVLAPDGRPVAGASVSASADGETRWNPWRNELRAGDDGQFEIELEPGGTSWIEARAPGFAASARTPADVPPGGARSGLVLELRPAGRLEVAVHDGDGRAVERAEVRVTHLEERLERWSEGSGAGVVFEGLPAGTYELSASHTREPAGSETLRGGAELVAGQTCRVVLGGAPRRPISLQGRVHRGGEAVAGGEVVLEHLATGRKTAPIDDEGRFELVLDGPGEYGMFLWLRDSAASNYSRVMIPDQERVELDVELPGASLAGRLFDPEGAPVAGAELQVEPDPEVADLSGAGSRGLARTDAEGRFRFVDLGPGQYLVHGPLDLEGVSPGELAPVRAAGIELAEGERREDLELRLAYPARLSGVVRDSRGTPTAAARVIVLDERGRPLPGFECRTSSNGHYSSEGLRPGPVHLIALAADEISRVEGPLDLAPGAQTEVDLRLVPAGALAVEVRESGGRRVGAALRVIDEYGVDLAALVPHAEVPLAAEGAAETAVDGRPGPPVQRIYPLPPGAYTVRAINHDRVAAERRAVVVAGMTTRVELVLGR